MPVSPVTPYGFSGQPPPLLVIEMRFRLEGCRTEQEKRQRLAPLFRHWGRNAHVALREEPLPHEPERAAVTGVIALPQPAAQREADDLLAWTERNLSAWLEDFRIHEH